MPTIAQQTFSRNYWRMLLRAATWHEAWLSLRRVHKDARARKHLLWLFRYTAGPLVWILILCCTGLIIFILPIVLLVGLLGRSHRREARLAALPKTLTPEQRKEIRTFFAKLAIVFAVSVDRAASEAFLKTKVLPDHLRIISRRVHIDLLKTQNLWDWLTTEERTVLMIPDGGWEWSLIHQIASGQEQLRLLRWILRIDIYLPLLGTQLKFDSNMYQEIVRSPQLVLNGEEFISPEGLETAIKTARTFYIRCLAEEVVRGYRNNLKPETEKWAEEISASLSGKQSEDLVLDDKIVSEAEEQTLKRATFLAGKRHDFLLWTQKILTGANPPLRNYESAPPESTKAETEPAQTEAVTTA